MLKIGDIVSTSYFPEVVEIKKCDAIADFYILEAVGQDTSYFYDLMIEKEKLNEFHQVNKESKKKI